MCLFSGQQRVLWLLPQWVFYIPVLHAGSRLAPRQATFLRQPAAPPAVMASGWQVTDTWRWSHCQTNILARWSPSPDWHHTSWSWMVSGHKATCEIIFTAVSNTVSFLWIEVLGDLISVWGFNVSLPCSPSVYLAFSQSTQSLSAL